MNAERIVLLVDDDPAQVELARRAVLKVRPAARIEAVGDGAQAIDYLAGKGRFRDRTRFPLPSLMLLDLYMPKKTGFDVLEWRRGRPELAGIDVVVTTASLKPADLDRAFELRDRWYLIKPVDPDSLAKLLNLKILVVDDEPAVRLTVARELEKEFGTVSIAQAGSPEELARELESGGFDLVVTDFHLRWTTGLEVLAAVKARFPAVPVIMHTATGSEEIAVEAMKAGLDDYVLKSPKHRMRLRAAVRAALDRVAEKRARREAEARYLRLFESAPIGLYRTSAEGRILAVNATLIEMLGCPDKTAVEGRNVAEFYADPSEREGWVEVLREHGMVRGHVLRVRRQDGAVITVEDNAQAFRNAAGAVEYFEGSMADITDRKRAEDQLRELTQRLSYHVDNSPLAVIEWGPDMRLVRWSGEAERIFGWKAEEVLGKRIEELRWVYSEDQPRVAEVSASLQDGTDPRHLSANRNYRRDGSVVHCEWYNSSLLDESGKLRSILSLVQDVTERKRAEEALRRNEERFRALVQNSTDVIGVMGADGTLSYVGPSVKAVAGYEPEEVVGLRFLDLIHPGDRPAVLEAVERGMSAAGAMETVECRIRHADGSWHVFETTGINLLDNPAVAGLVLHSRDISERRRFEEQLRQAQKMEAIGQLAGGVAHDFNNLLQAMLSHLQLLRAAPGRLDAEIVEIEAQIRRGAALARQLLLFSRREATRRQPLDLDEAIRDAAGLLRRLLRENIALELELGAAAEVVEADPGQLDQVLMNLVVNAADAMGSGGRITIATGRDGDQVWFTVQDTGTGIPDAIRERIFEPFFTTKPAGQGTGLGLSVVHGIVAQHGGRVEIQSEVGRGTTFRVLLPRAGSGEHPAAKLEQVAEELPEGRGERVLIVEDEPAAREGLAQILASLGYQVTAAGSGAEAGLVPEEPPFDLLLTDLMLPDVAGSDLASSLKDRWPGLLVIVMSGYAPDDALRAALGGSPLHFLQKPFGMAALAQELRAALAGRDPQ